MRIDVQGVLAPRLPIRLRELKANDVEPDGQLLRPTGDDPHLVFLPPRWAEFPTGIVRLGLTLDLPSPRPVDLELHVDTGTGYAEDTKVVLPTTNGGRLEVPVRLPEGLVSLRLDVPPDIGRFGLSAVTLRRLRADDPDHDLVWTGPADAYRFWVARHDRMNDARRERVRAEVSDLDGPTFSVVMPVHNPPVEFLREAIASAREQLWPHWELCIADDDSTDPAVVALLDAEAAADDRIRLHRRTDNGGISRASNDALGMATGEWVALLDHDDVLPEHALATIARAIADHPDAAVVYSDEDKLSPDGQRVDPYFKPDLSRELLWGQNVVSHLGAYRRDVVTEVGGFRPAFDGSQDYDLALRVIERVGIERVVHVPEVLYHWRILPGSVALADDEKTWAHDAAVRALEDHLDRTGTAASVEQVPGTRYRRVVPDLPSPAPLVSVVVPTRDRPDLLGTFADGLLNRTFYDNLELLVIDNGSVEADALALLDELSRDERVRVVRDDGDFNWSRLNNLGIREANGDLVCLCNDDLEVVEGHEDWLTELVRWGVRDEVGAVGAKLHYPDGRIQHAGVVLGWGGDATHAYQLHPGQVDGQMGRARLVQQYQAVTGACLMARRQTFDRLGGFDADQLAIAYSDVDWCLRVRDAGLAVVWTPFAELVHHESASRGPESGAAEERRAREAAVLRERWGALAVDDPFANPNLSREHTDFRVWPF